MRASIFVPGGQGIAPELIEVYCRDGEPAGWSDHLDTSGELRTFVLDVKLQTFDDGRSILSASMSGELLPTEAERIGRQVLAKRAANGAGDRADAAAAASA